MAWFALARVLFVAAVAYAAALLQPLPLGLAAQRRASRSCWPALVVLFECGCARPPPTRILGALIGCVIGLGDRARDRGRACSGPTATIAAIEFLHSFLLIVLPYLGLVLGAQARRVARAGAARQPVPRRRPGAPLQDSRHQRHHRRPHRRRLRDRLHRRHARHPAVRAEGAAARRRLRRLAEAQPRPARPRHPAEDPEDVRRRGHRSPTSTFPDVREVDLKLIELARTLQGKIVTNDFNLNKVAQLRGVEVLNVNELANSLKPVVLPGEIMKVFILKEGKEYNQGVAYLDDGTMVVVDNARKMISKTIDIVVTSVLQTTAGKMIFGRYIEPGAGRPGGAAGRPAAERRRARRRPSSAATRVGQRPQLSRPDSPRRLRVPPYHWWRTVFFLIPAITRLHDRARRGVDRLEPVRSPRLLRARLRARLVVADPEDDRRPRDGRGARARSRRARRTSSCRTTRASTTSRSSSRRCRISCGSSPRSRWRRFPVLGWHLKRGGHLFVDRRHPDRAGILKRWRALVSEGLSLIIFAEGTRSWDGRVARFKAGSFLLAIEAGLPVVPHRRHRHARA